ncbi:CocE/NonD family hydrolase [Bacillus sp. Marseille-P3661]|uniref:CocE/NonD family hydrolase n=1 Tax=Bacillus sp. Marseille-P3661 TaxID=1936234 RepID=UPI001CA4742E|nr:CocE/NonD family hydrolase [Bacillus sp. Marseille-P3661]
MFTENKDRVMREEISDNMRILWQVPIQMTDGIILRADVFMPIEEGMYPTIMTYGPYAKGQAFQEAYENQWNVMVGDFPGIMEGSTNKYQNWETADPEKWVPYGYSLIRIDSRGAGWSEGIQQLWSKKEIEDFYECIEWAAEQPWSDGNIGLLGISYYAANQWQVAAMQPPHLKAIIPWEGTSDWYREYYYHGGIRSTFVDSWLPKQLPMQYGYGSRGRKNPNTGEWASGPVTLSDEELKDNRVDLLADVKAHPLFDEYHQELAVDWSKVTIPILSAANWGGAGLHLRGNVEGYLQAASENKWLEIHGLEHWTHFYTPYGVDLQRRFFDYFLKGEENGWDQEPRVRLQVRYPGDKFVERTEEEWPIPRTKWTKMYLAANNKENTLNSQPPEKTTTATYEPLNESVTFYMPAMEEDTEITGPLAAKLFISSETTDADLFLTIRLFSPTGEEEVFRGAMDAHAPVAQGWLRASHRKLDEIKSLPYRPYHAHNKIEPLTPGNIYEVDVEIWPTSIVVPKGYRLALSIGGNDYEFDGEMKEENKKIHRYPSKGCGPFLHKDRPANVYGGKVTVYTGGSTESYLYLPVIPN